MYYDFIDLITPIKINEGISTLKFDDEEIQLLSIKIIHCLLNMVF